jgi:hypothetical protein
VVPTPATPKDASRLVSNVPPATTTALLSTFGGAAPGLNS